MTPEEAARHRQHLAEQERIAQILRGTARVESDATLGVSNIEMLRGRAAIQDHAQGKKASARATPSSAPPKPPARSKKRKAGAVHQQSTVDWNPLARGMPRLSPKKVKVEAAGDLFAQYGLAKDEPVADVIAASYPGPNGPQELTRALEAMGNDHARRRKKLEQLVRTFRERRRA